MMMYKFRLNVFLLDRKNYSNGKFAKFSANHIATVVSNGLWGLMNFIEIINRSVLDQQKKPESTEQPFLPSIALLRSLHPLPCAEESNSEP